MTPGSAVAVSSSRLVLHFATVRTVALCCLLVACVLDSLCLVALLVGIQCLPTAHLQARRNGLDEAITTNGDGGVEMEPAATTDSAADTADGRHITGSGDFRVSEAVAEIVAETVTEFAAETAAEPGNVKKLIKRFEFVEKPGTDAFGEPPGTAAAVKRDGLVDGHARTSRDVDRPGVGVVGQLVKRFDGSEKVPTLDDKPSLQVINKTATVIHLIDRFNNSATV